MNPDNYYPILCKNNLPWQIKDTIYYTFLIVTFMNKSFKVFKKILRSIVESVKNFKLTKYIF